MTVVFTAPPPYSGKGLMSLTHHL